VMCNLTSLAMCLEQLGIPNPKPSMQYEDYLEQIRVQNGYGARTTFDGWGNVAKHLGATVGWIHNSGDKALAKDFWLTKVRP